MLSQVPAYSGLNKKGLKMDKQTILVVDDEKDVLFMLEKRLAAEALVSQIKRLLCNVADS